MNRMRALVRSLVNFWFGLSIGLAAIVCAAPARADVPQPALPASDAQPWPLNDEDPESSIPGPELFARYPMQAAYFLMTVSERGEKALEDQHYAAAIRYFRTLARVMPERAVSYARLCEAYEGLGDHEKALTACHEALGKQGLKASDAAFYVRLVLQGSEKLSPDELADVDQVILHLQSEKVDGRLVSELDCEVALHQEDSARLERCSGALLKLEPNSPSAASFAWALALKHQNYRDARHWLAQAKLAGVKPDALAQMEDGTRELRNAWLRVRMAMALGLLACLAAVGLWLARRRRIAEPLGGT